MNPFMGEFRLLILMYEVLMYVHLVTIVPCVFLGAYLIGFQKGTAKHRALGKAYMGLIFFSSCVSLFMEARVGPQLLGHFGWIHSLSFLTMLTVPKSIRAVQKGNIAVHKRTMVLLYFSGLLIAGGFTFVPGRFLYEVFFT